MDKELLRQLKIECETLEEAAAKLEEKELDTLLRLEAISDNNRRAELEEYLKKIEEQKTLIEKEIKESAKKPEDDLPSDAGKNTETDNLPMADKHSKDTDNIPTVASEKPQAAEKPNKENKNKENKKKDGTLISQQKAEQAAEKEKQARIDAQIEEMKKASKTGAGVAGSTASVAAAAPSEKKAAASDSAAGIPENKELGDLVQAFASERGNEKDIFTRLLAFAEDNSLKKDDRAIAEWLVAICYRDGKGIAADKTRAKYWFEKAADLGNAESALYLGRMWCETQPNDAEEKKKNLDKGLDYFYMAAKNGNKTAMRKFVEVCSKEALVSKRNLRRGIRLYKVLIQEEQGSFEQNELKTARKKMMARVGIPLGNQAVNGSVVLGTYPTRDVLCMVGTLLICFGAVLFFGHNIQCFTGSDDSLGILKGLFSLGRKIKLPNLIPKFISDFSTGIRETTGFMALQTNVDVNGIEIMVLGMFLTGFTAPSVRGGLSELINEVGIVFVAFLFVRYISCIYTSGALTHISSFEVTTKEGFLLGVGLFAFIPVYVLVLCAAVGKVVSRPFRKK